MKNNYIKIIGLLMVVFLTSGALLAQEKLQVKKNQQTEPAKQAVEKKPAQVSKKIAGNPMKPVQAASKKKTSKPTNGTVNSRVTNGTSVTTGVKPATQPTTHTSQKKNERVKQVKPTLEQLRAIKKQYYSSQPSSVTPEDTIKKKKPARVKPVQNPKRKLIPGDRIVGGSNYDIEQIPWQVWLGGCGGTIIGEEWVVTAAHCSPAVGDDVYAGQTTISGGASQMRIVAEVFIHPDWTGSTVEGHDIALIRVSVPFDFNDPKVQPIPYATPADEANGLTDPCTMALVSGWGSTSPGGSSPNHLQGVLVPIVSNELTDIAYIGWNGLTAGWITDDQIAAGDYAPQACSAGNQDGGEDSCQGDSGGPFVVPNASGTGWILAGIVSWGESCADPDYPGLYGRVSEFAAWIEEITGIVNNQYPNLIISEVVHGDESGGNPKYVEIHNAGTEAYNLDDVAIRVFTDGASTPSATIDLPNTTLNPGETYVVANAAFEASWGGPFTTETADLINGGITGNGNDVYQLYDTENEGAIDVFGQIGSGDNYWDYEESIVTRNPWIVEANSGGFNETAFGNDWNVTNYEATGATPGTHLAEIPAFDATLVAVTGIRTGQTFVGCDGTANVLPGLTVSNSGTGNISALDVEIEFNGVPSAYTINFSPALEPGTSRTVSLPELPISVAGDNTYAVEIDDEDDGNPTNDEGEELEFSVLIFTDATTLNVNTTVDEYSPQENMWVIKDLSGNVIAESSTLAGAGTDIQTACVEDGSYTITLIDTFGDGIFAGGLTVTLEDGTPIIVIDGEDPIFDNQCNFFFCPDPSERTITIPFTIPYVPTPDLGIELINPAGSTFAYTSCETVFTPAIRVTNTGNIPVTEFAISFGIGSPSETAEFDNLLLQPGASAEFILEEVTLAAGSNILEANITDFNGTGPDGNATNDSDEATINFTLDEELDNILVAVTTDSYPEETSWEIRDASGNIVATGSGYPEDETTEVPVCLPDGDYTFILKDSYGDGIFADNPVVLKTEAGVVIAILSGDFEDETSAEFSLPFTGSTDVALAVIAPAAAASLEDCAPLADVLIELTNEGASPVTSVTVTYAVGEAEETVELTGLLLAGESVEVALGKIAVAPGANTLTVAIIDVNGGGPDSNDANDEASSDFTFTVDTGTTGLTVEVNLDSYPSETSWEITDQDGNVVAESSSYSGMGNTTQVEVACLASGCYTFTLLDSWGDGGPDVTLLVNGVPLATVGAAEWEDEASAVVCVGDVTYPVSNLEAEGASATSIELTWSYAFEADNFAIFRSSTGLTGSYVSLGTVPSSQLSYTSTGLQPETMYYYSVIASKEGENSIPMYAAASTLVNLGETTLVEGFEGETFPPAGWTMLDEDEDGNDWFHYTDEAVGEVVAFEGVKCAASASWNSQTELPLTPDNWLITPALTIAADYKLFYHIAAQDPDWTSEVYSIMISTTDTDPASFTEVFKETLASAEWGERTVDLNAYAGQTIFIAFRHYDVTDFFYMKLDNVIVGIKGEDVEPVAVPEPANFTATAASAYSIDLAWDYEEDADAFELWSSTTGAVGSFELVEILAGDARAYSATGLTPATSYYFQLSATIDEESSVAAAASATTEDAALGASVLAEGFEGETFPPAGWTMLDEDEDGNDWFHYTDEAVGEVVAFEGVKCAASASWNSQTELPLTPDNWLITPALTIAADYKLFYHIAAQDPDWTSEVYSIMISTTDTDPASFTEVFKETLASAEWGERTLDLSAYAGQTIFIAFRHYDVTDFFYMKLDDVKVGIPGTPPPAAITGLAAEALSENSVALTWEDLADNEDGFNVQVAYTANGPWTDYTPTVAADAEAVTISSSTFITYGENFFRVQAFHETAASAWSPVVSATTNINQPTGFTAQFASASEVELSWNDESSIEDGYRIEMATDDEGPWTLVTETAANAETFAVGDLLPVTQYFFRVRSYNENGISDWSETSITTLITSVEESSLSSAISVFPNPTRTGTFSIRFSEQLNAVSDYRVTVLDSKGLVVDTFTAVNKQKIDSIFALRNPAKGMYMLEIRTGKETVVKKLVVE
jgi:hypothetical protein